MVIENKQTTVAYRCPSCGSGVMSVVDVFRLSADMLKLKCDCGNSEMVLVRSKEAGEGPAKIRFTVPCMLCPNPHSYTVSSNLLFNKDLFVLPCPYADINIAMMGDIDRVKAELSRTELELIDMLEKSGIDSFDALHSDAFLTDPQVLEIVTYMIKELDAEGKIYCRCPEGVEGDYEVELTKEGLKISCKGCGASKIISTASLIEAHEFLNADSLTLE
ncbi:MAG: hypothetical protein E7653_06190 [Ruminococcaceae bacterium]|nr:hypothetical protein [Oscillospiraceae bacterium]